MFAKIVEPLLHIGMSPKWIPALKMTREQQKKQKKTQHTENKLYTHTQRKMRCLIFYDRQNTS